MKEWRDSGWEERGGMPERVRRREGREGGKVWDASKTHLYLNEVL